MKARVFLPVVLALAFLLRPLPLRGDNADRFGGRKNADLLASATSATVWRMFDHGLKKLGSGNTVSSNLVAQLTTILLDEHSYMPPDLGDNCIHEPDLLFIFGQAAKKLDIFFCLDCHAVMVKIGEGPKGEPPVTKLSLLTGSASRRIVRIVKQVFPNEYAIQALDDTEPAQAPAPPRHLESEAAAVAAHNAMLAAKKFIFVGDGFRIPGRYNWRSGVTLKEAVEAGGGFTHAGAHTLVLKHADGTVERLRVRAGGPLTNALKPDDYILVP
jgi:hypothetical protein